MLTVRHGRRAVPPLSSATARSCRRARHRNLGRLAAALVALALLAPAAAASSGSTTLTSPALTAAAANAATPAPRGPVLADLVNPTVGAIDPASAPNDIDSPITITGTDFAAVMDGTGTVVVTSPTASLGATALSNVTWVNATTLTATVPWGMNPGVYGLTVVNPDGVTATLPAAYTVTQGIGQWNGGNFFGGDVHQILMKPGDPDTLYAPAYGIVGLFRSTDAGASWTFTGGELALGNYSLAVTPQHPDWLYAYMYNGVHRSTDQGDTWTVVMPDTWPDGRTMAHGQVYPSPYDPQVLFVSSYIEPDELATGGDAQGLIRSTDGGASWEIVESVNGAGVQDVAFDPNDASQMVLVTRDAHVYHSGDAGSTWSQVASPPISSMSFWEQLAYNPYVAGQVWIVSQAPDRVTVGASVVLKSTDAALSGWQNVTPGWIGGPSITFTGADSVYVPRNHSTDGGAHWNEFGPMTGVGDLIFDPANPQIGYLADNTYGVQKTADGGLTWQVKNRGLAGMTCSSLDVSRANPLRVYAACGGSPGIYRSDDGINNWTYLPVPTTNGVRVVREDPFDPQRLYVAADGFIVSTDGGESWSDLGWNLPPSSPAGFRWVMEPDPFQPGHLLIGMVNGDYNAGSGFLYDSSDYGASWQAVAMPQALAWISGITFDPVTPGLVYVTTRSTGVYRSADGGISWRRIDDQAQAGMRIVDSIAIATHPQHMLLAASYWGLYRSTDSGTTWQRAENNLAPGTPDMLVDGDSTRLYRGTGDGLFFSGDAGDTWTRAAGAFGRLQILALGYADANGHTILYAATSGGAAGATGSAAAARARSTAATASTLVGAGIYRHVQVPATKTFTSSGAQDGWILESRHTSNKGGTLNATATTFRLGDNAAKKQYRGILSFTTGAGLPDTAVITKVTLRFRRQGVTGGGNPVTMFRGLLLDIRKGTFGTAALQASDFQAAASRSYGPFKATPISNWYTINLTGAKAYINKLSSGSGRTQIRLRFKLDDNNNAIANYLSLYSGNASATARPQLIVTYYVP